MLGRHIYRVTPLDGGEWSLRKDGEAAPRGRYPTREAAANEAAALARADEPSKVVVEERGGVIRDERLFGADAALELDRAVDDATGKGKKRPTR